MKILLSSGINVLSKYKEILFLLLINIIMFQNYWLGIAIPPWDFIGGGMVEQYGFYEYGSFFNPPSWFPNAWFGIPEYQMLQDGGWFLPTLVVAEFLNWYPENAARLQAALIFIGSVGFYALSKHFVNTRYFALLGAVIYSFNPAFFSNAQHYGVVRSAVLIPWLLFIMTPRIIFEKWWAIPAGSLIFFQLITGSYPGNLVSSIYTCLILFFYFIYFENKRIAYTIRIAVIFLSGLLIGLVRYLPTLLDLGSFPQNITNSSDLGYWNFSTFIYPFVSDNLIGDPSMRSIYLGPLFLSLIPITLILLAKNKIIIFWLALAFFSLTMMVSSNVTDLFRSILPFTNISRFGMTDWRTTFYISVIFITLLTFQKINRIRLTHLILSEIIFLILLLTVRIIGTRLNYSESDISYTFNVLVITNISIILYITASILLKNKYTLSVILFLILVVQTVFYIEYYNKNKLTWESKEIDQNIYGQSFRSISRVIEYPLTVRPPRILLTPPPFAEWQYRTDYRYNKFWLTGEFGALGYHNVKDNQAYKSLEVRLQRNSDPVINYLLSQGLIITMTDNTDIEESINNCLVNYSTCQTVEGVEIQQLEFNRESELYSIKSNRDFIMLQNEMYSPVWSARLCEDQECFSIDSFPILDSLRAWKIPKGNFEFRSEAKTIYNFERWLLFWVGVILSLFSTLASNRKLARNS
jgi:hypothetical protein